MMNSDFMKTLDSFKSFMISDSVPNYVVHYCENLNDIKWRWLYVQMIEPMIITANIDYLFYVLRWILKSDFQDLTYELYFYDVMNPENRSQSLIKDKYWQIFNEQYYLRFMDDLSIIY